MMSRKPALIMLSSVPDRIVIIAGDRLCRRQRSDERDA